MLHRICTLLSVLALLPLGLQAQTNFEGFRGLNWGTPLQDARFEKLETPRFKFQKKIEGHSYYTIENENLQIGTAQLELIYYVFDEKNRLCKVILEGKPESYKDMLYILEHKYGTTDKQYKTIDLSFREWQIEDGLVRFYENEDKNYSVHLKGPCEEAQFREINSNVTDF